MATQITVSYMLVTGAQPEILIRRKKPYASSPIPAANPAIPAR